jgi:hypothetical protein
VDKEISIKKLLTILFLLILVLLSIFIVGIPYKAPNLFNICKISTININVSCLLNSLIGSKLTYAINWFFVTIVITFFLCIKKQSKRTLHLSFFLLLILIILLNQSILPIGGNKLLSRKTYTNLDSLKKSFDFTKYPTTPFFEPFTNIDKNPLTGNKLEYKKFENFPGYGCCESPSYTFIFDKKEKIFWIRYYQASLLNMSKSIYGPFRLKEQ